MSDLDRMTDKQVADELENLRMHIYHQGIGKHELSAYDDALMIQATKRLSGITFPEELIDELRRLVSRHGLSSYQRLEDYIKHPEQFQIYHRLGLFNKWFHCQACCGDTYCTNPSVWMTDPHTDKAIALFKKIQKDAGVDEEGWGSDESIKALSDYFGETLPTIFETTFRCDAHIGKSKEIAIKVGRD